MNALAGLYICMIQASLLGFNLEKSVCFGSGNVVRVSGRGRVRHSDGGDFSSLKLSSEKHKNISNTKQRDRE